MIPQRGEYDWLYVVVLCTFNFMVALGFYIRLDRVKNSNMMHIFIFFAAIIGTGCSSWLLLGSIVTHVRTYTVMPYIQQAIDEGCAGRNLTATFSFGNTYYSTSGQFRWDSVDKQISCYQDINSWVCTCK